MALEKLKITVLYDSTDTPPPRVPSADGKLEPAVFVHEQIADALAKKGHTVTLLPAERRVRALALQLEKDQSDVIFNVCESLGGDNHHEQHVAALLELLGKPFTGSTPLGLSLAQDKGLSKKFFSFHKLPYPKFSIMEAGTIPWSDDLHFPLFVKPLNEDASVGIDRNAIVHTIKGLIERMSYIHTEIGSSVLIEEYIDGRELYVGVLGNDSPVALPVIEWDFSKLSPSTPRIATAEAKWDEDSEAFKAPEIFPEDIPQSVLKKIQEVAVTAYKALHLRGYGRVDFRLRNVPKGSAQKGRPSAAPSDDEWEFYIIEVNPNPYLDRKAELAVAGRKYGLSFPALLEHIVEQAVRGHRGSVAS